MGKPSLERGAGANKQKGYRPISEAARLCGLPLYVPIQIRTFIWIYATIRCSCSIPSCVFRLSMNQLPLERLSYICLPCP